MAALMAEQPDWREDLAAIEAAARDAGIVPGDPGYPFVCGLARMLDRFGHRIDATIRTLEDMPRRVTGEHLANAAMEAVNQNALSIVRSRHHRTLVLISTAWALAMLMGIGATFWVGYSTGSTRRALSLCTAGQVFLDPQSKRHYCTFSVWVD
jgi:hypothetical protein